MKKRLLVIAIAGVLLLALLPGAGVAQGPTTQMALLIDGSGSISETGANSTDFQTMLDGIAAAVEDRTCVPHNGSVELMVIQFSSTATLEVGPTVLNSHATANAFANQVRAIGQMGNMTNYQAAFDMARTTMLGSPNFATTDFQAVNISTDGNPTAGSPDPYTGATNARANLIARGIDEIDVEAIGAAVDVDWLRDDIAYPQPGTVAPPYHPGWVVEIANFRQYASAMCVKFQQVVPEPEPEVEDFVPEPGSIILLASGLMGMAGYAGLRLRKK